MYKLIRVLHVVPNMNVGGIETLIMNMYRNINRSKIQFDFLVHYKEECFYDNEIRKLGGKIYRLSIRDDNNIIKYIEDLNRFFSDHKEYKIVHGHMVSTAIFYLYFAKKYGVPVRIIHSHNTATNPGIKGKTKKILAKLSTIYANKYFACGKLAGIRLFGNKSFEIINNGIETNKFAFNNVWRKKIRNELGAKNSTKVYGHIGRFNTQKNHDFLIEVFCEINRIENNCLFVLVGDGELRELIMEKAIACGIGDKIKYLGIRSDTNKIYQALDVFILPSLFEGFPVVAVECQAAGLPLIVSDTVSSEIKLINNVEFLSLYDKPSVWADKAVKLSSAERRNTREQVVDAGFEIESESIRLSNIYLEALKTASIQ